MEGSLERALINRESLSRQTLADFVDCSAIVKALLEGSAKALKALKDHFRAIKALSTLYSVGSFGPFRDVCICQRCICNSLHLCKRCRLHQARARTCETHSHTLTRTHTHTHTTHAKNQGRSVTKQKIVKLASGGQKDSEDDNFFHYSPSIPTQMRLLLLIDPHVCGCQAFARKTFIGE